VSPSAFSEGAPGNESTALLFPPALLFVQLLLHEQGLPASPLDKAMLKKFERKFCDFASGNCFRNAFSGSGHAGTHIEL